ncbi:proline/glycine betaine ABC transporter permease [Halomonas campisalis]|uniref:Proline/glycine betaine ABC transporter permease n=1 Tax=Billgrantia campisalis TaxID=74661 RepID=A0ABS9PB55_9GAMM|nr:proline/glycine betaine ABC transporter permease [Halomonas campisalis]MCG6658492.1 proline/glycine betaine ABC transporter permease [Halomonas campisalis]MDR5863353.1 proline/glycine betaine ABC transporter permease [Halomonas campisalis]
MSEILELLRQLITDPFGLLEALPVRQWITDAVNWVVSNFRDFFRSYLSPPVRGAMELIQTALEAIPPGLFLVGIFLIGWRAASWRVGLFSFIALALVGFMGVWNALVVTLSLVITAVLFCMLIGLPLGILCSRSDRFANAMRPILDIMQTTPPFVYLVPAVMLFGIGNVPGLIATIIFAMPPMIRLTNLGIRQVSTEYIEAAEAFGSTPRQILWKVQFPLALPTVMAGLNQTIMLALSMVVIAAIIGAGGLGLEVYAGLERLNIGQAFVGGIGIVLLAMVLDRITQGLGEKAPGKSK